MVITQRVVYKTVVYVLFSTATFFSSQAVNATNNGLADWRDTYPNSNSDDAGCQLCHGGSTTQLNAYGRDLCLFFEQNGVVPSDWSTAIKAIENLDSDLDPNSSSNDVEIANHTQPGWTTTANPLYIADFTQGCAQIAVDSTVPNNVPTPYDIAVEGDPIANPGGPYEALVGAAITFDGSGSTDDGTIMRYDWSFGDGTEALDGGPNPAHTYNAEGVYTVRLTVTDNDDNTNAATTTATISPVQLLDLDIAALQVSTHVRVGKSIRLRLKVENNGSVMGQAIATVVGVQNGIEVYRLRLNVFDNIGRGDTTFDFGSYTPLVPGDIVWVATINDGDPDVDETTETTVVK
ncbi:MAG: PKD domain-containing protein [Gammaproteobacteria bacterium]